jgi:hypothetical protein
MMAMMISCLMSAGAWLFTGLIFALIAWWVWKLRGSVRYYIRKIDKVSVQMGESAIAEDPKEYAKRLKLMSDEDLVREIESTRQFNSWGREIAAAIEGLKASVPLLVDR